MGAIVQWVITHLQRIAAWALIIAAVGSVFYAVGVSGVYTDVTTNLGTFARLIDIAAQKIPDVTSSMNRAISESTNAGGGWVQLITYMVYLDGWGELTTLLAANFEALVLATVGVALSCAGMAVVVFLYSRKRMLANAMAGSPIAIT